MEGKGSLRKQSLERLVRRVGTPNGTGEGREAEERTSRLKALREKKERLGYAVERLTLQSQQRQRQLRMSAAATGTALWRNEECMAEEFRDWCLLFLSSLPMLCYATENATKPQYTNIYNHHNFSSLPWLSPPPNHQTL